MNLLIKNVRVLDGVSGEHRPGDVLVVRGKFTRFAPHVSMRGTHVVDADGGYLVPGIIETSLDHAHIDPYYSRATQERLGESGVTTLLALQPSYSINPNAAYDLINHRTRATMHINIAPVIPALFLQEGGHAGIAQPKALHYAVPVHAKPADALARIVEKIGTDTRPLFVSFAPRHTGENSGALANIASKAPGSVVFSETLNAPEHETSTHYTHTSPLRTRIVPASAFLPDWMIREYDKTGNERIFADKKNHARIAKDLPDLNPHTTFVAQCQSRPYWVGHSIAQLVQRFGSGPKAVLATVVAAAPYATTLAYTESGFKPEAVTDRTILTSGVVAVEQKEHAPRTFSFTQWTGQGWSFMNNVDVTQKKNIVAAFSSIPARVCGLALRGRIAAGYWADFQLFDKEWKLRSVFVNGRSIAGDHNEPEVKPGTYLCS